MRATNPKHVNEFRDRYGRIRRYFRRPGQKAVPLPGEPNSAEFMAAYLAALGQAKPNKLRIPIRTVSAAIGAYYGSTAFLGLADTTRKARREFLERFRANHGDAPIGELTQQHVAMILSRLTPAIAKGYWGALHGWMTFAVSTGLRKDDPTIGVKRAAVRSEAIHNWTDEEIAQFKARWPLGSKQRLAMLLLLCTAQRRSDVVRIGPADVTDGMIWVREQQKTKAEVWIPIHPELAETIAATKIIGTRAFLVGDHGEPYQDGGSFGCSFRKWCDAAGLPQCSAHGLRHAGLTWLAEMGCTAHELMAIGGHKTLAQVQHYVERVNRKRLARSAIAKIAGHRLGEPS